jgi:rhodanese-related sulfurtransferase
MHSGCQSEITVAEAHQRVANGESVALIDVREPEEHALASLAGAELIPMGSIPQRLAHLELVSGEKSLIVFCHHGVRSLHVVNWLRAHGIENAQSMEGGIDAWSRSIDPTVPRY